MLPRRKKRLGRFQIFVQKLHRQRHAKSSRFYEIRPLVEPQKRDVQVLLHSGSLMATLGMTLSIQINDASSQQIAAESKCTMRTAGIRSALTRDIIVKWRRAAVAMRNHRLFPSF